MGDYGTGQSGMRQIEGGRQTLGLLEVGDCCRPVVVAGSLVGGGRGCHGAGGECDVGGDLSDEGSVGHAMMALRVVEGEVERRVVSFGSSLRTDRRLGDDPLDLSPFSGPRPSTITVSSISWPRPLSFRRPLRSSTPPSTSSPSCTLCSLWRQRVSTLLLFSMLTATSLVGLSRQRPLAP